MKRFIFLQLFPVGPASGNKVMDEYFCASLQEAVIEFSNRFPHLELNKDGYAKIGSLSFCVAEFFS